MISMRPRGAGDFLWAISGRGAAAILQAASLVLLARFSNPADFGLTLGVQGILLTVAFLLGFGFGPYVTVQQAKSRLSEEVVDIVYLNQRTSMAAGGICLTILLIGALFQSTILMLTPLAIAMAAHRNSGVWEGIALANGRIRLFGVTLMLRRLILVVVFSAAVVLGMNPILAYSVAYAGSEIIINWNLKRLIGRIQKPGRRPSFKSVLNNSMPYWVESVSVQLRGLDVSSAGLTGGAVASGLYAVPARLSSAILMLPSTFANLCLPRITRGTRTTFLRVAVASIPIMVVVISLLAILALYAEWIIVLLLGAEYVGAAVPTQIFCIGFVFLSIITIANAMAQGIGLAHQVALSSMVGAVLTILFVGLGAFMFGAEGASWGYSGAIFLHLVILGISSGPRVVQYLLID